MRVYPLDKVVLQFYPNAAAFLNGLTSNTPEAPQNAFLTVHGRIVATFDQVKISDDESWVVIERPYVEAVTKHLEKFLKLSKTAVHILERRVYFDLDGDLPLQPGDIVISQKAGRLVITTADAPATISEEAFTLFRLQNRIPVHGLDYTDEFILNVDEHAFVSYTKGCFLGQEPVSKVHNRSRPTWQLTVRAEDACSPEERRKMTSLVRSPETPNGLGFVFVENKPPQSL